MVLTRSSKYYTWVVFFLSFLLFSSLFLFRSFFSLVLFCLSFFSLALSLSFALFPLSLPPPSLIVSYQLERTSLHVFGAPESAFVATAFRSGRPSLRRRVQPQVTQKWKRDGTTYLTKPEFHSLTANLTN